MKLSTVSPWQRERSRKLDRMFRCIEGRIQRGQTIRRSVRLFAWFHKNRMYRCEPTRRFRVSRKSLIRLFYKWRASGKTPECLLIKYRLSTSLISRGKIFELARICVESGTTSFLTGYRKLSEPIRTVDAYNHATPAPLRAALVKLHGQRRLALKVERDTARLLQQMEKTK